MVEVNLLIVEKGIVHLGKISPPPKKKKRRKMLWADIQSFALSGESYLPKLLF